ncbi:Spliceosome-associated protein CWC15 [Manis javanica]|nr:Spliceosome-associated protein CWC15 [Manis javanica]
MCLNWERFFRLRYTTPDPKAGGDVDALSVAGDVESATRSFLSTKESSRESGKEKTDETSKGFLGVSSGHGVCVSCGGRCVGPRPTQTTQDAPEEVWNCDFRRELEERERAAAREKNRDCPTRECTTSFSVQEASVRPDSGCQPRCG